MLHIVLLAQSFPTTKYLDESPRKKQLFTFTHNICCSKRILLNAIAILIQYAYCLQAKSPFTETIRSIIYQRGSFFQKLLVAEATRWIRMCNLQLAKNCASVETSLATVHAQAQRRGQGVV